MVKNTTLFAVFKEKNENYEIYEPDEKEINAVKYETDDAAYENYHTYSVPEFKDSKGRKHSEYIYQEYRSVDGYDAETMFNYNEIIKKAIYTTYLANME